MDIIIIFISQVRKPRPRDAEELANIEVGGW